jgi:hypothetical protein
MTIIPPMPVEDVAREVLHHAWKQLPADVAQRNVSYQGQ